MEPTRPVRVAGHLGAVLLLVIGILVPLAGSASAAGTISQTFSYTGSTQAFTVPDGVSALTITLTGAQGGRGGGDSQGSPTPGGYRGVVTGTIDVTPGQELTLAVGGGGGTGISSRGSAAGGSAGLNPLAGYDGAAGGIAGPAGSSGGGGGSGAATVLRVGSVDLVAAGGGGNGGNGQYLPIVGRRAEATHQPRPDTTSTVGQVGKNTALACSPGFSCDGGASGAGGGGVQGGAQGDVQYGGASATEYFGFGGYPGANGTAGLAGLTAFYEYYAGNSANGSITISYDDGAPGAPRSLNGTPGPGRVELSWLAPTTSGSAPIVDYVVEYSTSAGGPFTTFDDGVSTGLGASVTGLTNGTTYWFRVSAVNAVATGPHSATMAEGVMASDVPGAPSVGAVTPLDGGLRVEVVPGPTDSPVTGWEFRLDDGDWQSAASDGTELTLGGLRNGISYGFRVRARNVVGASDPSEPATGTPRAVPGAPSGLAAIASAGSVSLSWNPPASDNGSAVTDYVVQRATSGAGPWSTVDDGAGTTTTAGVTGLTNGTTYLFRVAAVNAAGTGSPSSTAEATPFTVPDAPSISSLAPADGALVVDLDVTGDGGSPVARYEYRLDGTGAWISTGAATEPFTISGLANGTAYGVEVRAVNTAGTSPASTPAAATPRSVPAAPAISAIALDTGAVEVTFSLGSDGGSPVTNLQYSTDGGDSWITRSPAGTASPLTVSGLVGGQTYPVRLRAVNALGAGTPSEVSSVTAKGTPEAPTVDSVTPGDRSLTISVVAGPNGGSPITDLQYSLDGGGSWSSRTPASPSGPILVTGLANGTTYQVRVRAVNAAGAGTASIARSATPLTVPGAPSIDSDTISGLGGEIDVDFSAPSSDGGSPITTYQYSTDGGATWRNRATGSTGSPLTITTLSSDGATGLIGGQSYPVEIRAVNAAGPGAASALATGSTTTVPGAPAIDEVAVGGASARVTFDVPANGGAAISGYEYRLDGGTWTDTGSLAPEITLDGLARGTHQFEVRAVNSVGAGPASAPASIVVRSTPEAPEVTGVVAGDGQLSVAFAAGADGGSPITGYEYSTDGGVSWRTRGSGTTASPLVIATASGTGNALTNGRIYTVQIRALNAEGAGAASASTLAAPLGTPDAPTGVVVRGGDRSLTVEFTAAGDGGSAVTRIEYRLDGGTWTDTGSLSSPFTVPGLDNGTAHTVEVRAVNALGAGDASAPVSGTPMTLPDAPGSVTAVGGDGVAHISWIAPADTGGGALEGSIVTLFDQSVGGSAVAGCPITTATTCTVSGLDNGTTYHASVQARTTAGTGPASAPRVAVRPVGVPVVSLAALVPGATSIQVDVDTDDGGAPLSSYHYRLDGGVWTSADTTSEPFMIAGLATGRSYQVEVRAANGVGIGPASAPMSATPRTVPGQVSAFSAAGLDASASLSWTAPVGDGGSPVTDYVVQHATSAGGPWTTAVDGVSAAPTAVVGGLTNGTTYLFRVAAVNAAGTGPTSSLASATPLAVPTAPNLTGLTVGSQFVQAAFSAPASNGGTPITGYQYQLDGGEWRNAAGTTSPLTISGLTNGRSYSVAIRAVNAVGGGATSNVRTATPFGMPAAVTGFLASPGASSVSLRWDPVDDNGSPITAYNVIRWSARTEGSIVASYQTTATSYDVTGLGAGTYYFTIEATNAAGTGQRSTPRTSAVVGATVPAAPSIDSVAVAGSQVEMSWTAGSAGSHPIAGHVVQYEQGGVLRTLVNSASPGSSASFALPAGADDYSIRVAMVSAAGVGGFSAVAPPNAATGAVSAVGPAGATLAGTVDPRGVMTSIGVEYSTDASDLGTPAASTALATPSSSDGVGNQAVTAPLRGLSPGTAYVARVRAVAGVVQVVGAPVWFTTSAAIATSGLDAVYDGDPVELTSTVEPSGLIVERSFEGISGTVYGPSATPPSAAGTYRVTSTVDDGDVTGSEVATLVIAPRPLVMTVTPVARDYDGTVGVQLDVGLSGIIAGDDVDVVTGSVRGRLASPSAGEDREVTIESDPTVLGGADAANYTVVVPGSRTVDIGRRAQSLVFRSSAPASMTIGATYTPVVESDAGRAPVLTVVSNPEVVGTVVCELAAGVVTARGAGSCVVVATQPGDGDVEPAGSVAQFLTVRAAAPSDPGPSSPGPTSPGPFVPPTSGGTGGPSATPFRGGRIVPRSVGTGSAGESTDSAADVVSPFDVTAGGTTDGPSTALVPVGGAAVDPAVGTPGSGSSATGSGQGRDLGEEVAADAGAGDGADGSDAGADGSTSGILASAGERPAVTFGLLLVLAAGAWFAASRWLAAGRRRHGDE